MPKNKFQEVIFTIMMVLVMVYAMICYNIALATGGRQTRFLPPHSANCSLWRRSHFCSIFFLFQKLHLERRTGSSM